MADENKNSEDKAAGDRSEMGFLDHLEELRWRIIKALLGIVIFAILCGVFSDWIMNNILLKPATKTNPPLPLINLKPYGQVVLYMQVAIICGIIISIPNIFYQAWKFIEPGLLPTERKYAAKVTFFTSICFLSGIAFAYFVMLPTALGFFAEFGTQTIQNNIAVDEYFGFIISVMLAAGVVFELPMVSFFLARIGILTPAFMKRYRRHAIVLILLLAGILTPSPDVTSQLLLGVPLVLLYEISIFIAKVAYKKSIPE